MSSPRNPDKNYNTNRKVITPAMEKRIVKHIERGSTKTDACEMVMIDHVTLDTHCANNPEFSRRIINAQQNMKSALVHNWIEEGKKNWTAAARFLACRYQSEYAEAKSNSKENEKFMLSVLTIMKKFIKPEDEAAFMEELHKLG